LYASTVLIGSTSFNYRIILKGGRREGKREGRRERKEREGTK
jgi:hypothetical protein